MPSIDRRTILNDELLHEECLTSNKTEALFVTLTLLFGWLYIWRAEAGKRGRLAVFSLFFCLIFLFYSLNYRTLFIRLTSQSLNLKFGIFSWVIPISNIDFICIDEIPLVMRMGGAGIHFMMINNRYRASFNFLEYPRVVIGLKKKVGPVQDISFSTRQPDQIIRLVQAAVAPNPVS